MAITLNATPGEDDSNAYATVAEADEYASYRVGGAAFSALTADQKIQALVTAAGDIDTLEDDPGFIGDRYDDVQAMAWPRDDGDLPLSLVRANIELAMSYAPAFATGSTIDVLNPSLTDGNVKRKKVGPLEKEWFAPRTTEATAFARFPAVVQRLLFGLIVQAVVGGWGSAEVVRGS